ncbi:MAG: DUF2252 domain-containing protein [Actinomycetota bacterium]|nr:DUF2252 domain-containing protein [Actinomycetota bacterium]
MPDARTDEIVEILQQNFSDLIEHDPAAFRQRFRKMANDPFAFYRGSACLFYNDVSPQEDPWVDEASSRVWIHGDLHAENFGTYMDGRGILVFDVNDFDEAYLGHWTWDLQRCSASLALMLWNKAFPDAVIDDVIERYVRAYVDQSRYYLDEDDDHEWALGLHNARGPVRSALHRARASTRIDLLASQTVLIDQDRTFGDNEGVRRLDDAERDLVLAAFEEYLESIPESRRLEARIAYDVKDVVGRSGFGVGSAGLAAYNVLIEGHSQALENDVVLSMKQGVEAALARVVDDERISREIQHHGHRTALSQRALQVHANPFLGWTQLDGTGFLVSELSPYEAGLEWAEVSEPEEVLELVEDLGRATAKVHCASDLDAAGTLVDEQVEQLVVTCVGDDEEGLVEWVREFAVGYAASTRDDHARFVEAFRSDAFAAVKAM